MIIRLTRSQRTALNVEVGDYLTFNIVAGTARAFHIAGPWTADVRLAKAAHVAHQNRWENAVLRGTPGSTGTGEGNYVKIDTIEVLRVDPGPVPVDAPFIHPVVGRRQDSRRCGYCLRTGHDFRSCDDAPMPRTLPTS